MSLHTRGMLIEYGLSVPPLALVFAFNPQQITRSRSVTVKTGGSASARGGYDFTSPLETARASQGVELKAETLQLDILIDATDKFNKGEALAQTVGIQPQLDTLRSMVEPKSQGPGGVQLLASIGAGGDRAFQKHESASVILFTWGAIILPVFLTGITQKEVMHLPSLLPYRAEVQLSMQVIESDNPFYRADKIRQTAMTALNVAQIGGL